MINRAVASRYARALFDAALEGGVVKEIESQFPSFVDFITASPDFRSFLNHPTIGNDNKKQAMEEMFKGKLNTLLLDFISLVIEKNREAYFELIWGKFHTLLMEHEGRAEARVFTPFPLSDDASAKLRKALEKVTGRKITIDEVEDKNLIGGVRVQVGDTVMDGSLRSRLEAAREHLLSAKVY